MSTGSTHPAITRLLALGGELTPPVSGTPRRKFDLEHMRTLLAALGNPERRFPSVLIAGTNGKGSTAATLASILASAGYATGLYTSPHLERPNERIRRLDPVSGSGEIGNDDLLRHLDQVEAAAATLIGAGALPHAPSFFETMTAIAFLWFAAQSVQIAVLEVGLGGRLDATNVVEPLLSIITDISLDHTEWLGDTLSAIAREKAGILRQGGTLVTLPQHPEVNQTIGEVAVPLEVRGVNAADYLPPRDYDPRTDVSVQGGEMADLPALRNRYLLALPESAIQALGQATLQIDSPLGGSHQQRNLALALAAAVELAHVGYPLSAEAVERGIREARWPARLEALMPAQTGLAPAVLLDAAHNPAGAWALRAALSALPVEGPRVLIFGAMADKAVDEIAQILFPVFDTVIATRVPGARAATLQQLTAAAQPTGTPTFPLEHPKAALASALEMAPGLLVVAGSVALAGAVRSLLMENDLSRETVVAPDEAER